MSRTAVLLQNSHSTPEPDVLSQKQLFQPRIAFLPQNQPFFPWTSRSTSGQPLRSMVKMSSLYLKYAHYCFVHVLSHIETLAGTFRSFHFWRLSFRKLRPSSWEMLGYSPATSAVTRMTLSGIGPSCFILDPRFTRGVLSNHLVRGPWCVVRGPSVVDVCL